MTFSELTYKRSDMAILKDSFNKLIREFSLANSSKIQLEIIYKINDIRVNFESQANLAQIRHTQDTRDNFYDTENNFFDNNRPIYDDLVTDFYKELIKSKYIDDLKLELGQHFFNLASMKIRSFSKEIIEDLKKENELTSQYTKLTSSAKIPFEGEVFNLAGIVPFHQNEDRDIRERSIEAKFKFFSDNKEELDDIYDKIVKVRTTMAKKLGFKNFIPLGYLRLSRSDFDDNTIKDFRDLIVKNIVPLTREIYKRQKDRLGLKDFKVWDLNYVFPTGNPKPFGNKDWMVDQAVKMYDGLSPETSEFFRFMKDRELLDLENREGKAGGGYCEALPLFKVPFIFSNFNGTSGDVDVLTHEAGHAFQVYSSMHGELLEYLWPTYECCEVHSMSMEFFSWPWMENFFKEDADKYRFGHLSEAINFLPYGCAVDEFQHMVYENPDVTAKERDGFWSDCEKRFLPDYDHGKIKYLLNGGFWQKQPHIYSYAFYYIDYVIAQICALQYWDMDNKDHKKAWDSYYTLCKKGGTNSFLNLIKEAGINNPFNKETIKSVTNAVKNFLESVDDSRF